MIYNGGPAFPRGMTHVGNPTGREFEWEPAQAGMSLRDWFAGMALQGGLAATPPREYSNIDPSSLAAFVYEIADALLEAREQAQPARTSYMPPDFIYTAEEALAETWSAEGQPGHIDGCTTYAACMASDCQCSCHD